MKHRSRALLVAGGAGLTAVLACTTEPVTLDGVRVEGRAYENLSADGIEGVDVALSWDAGAFGRGRSSSVSSDAAGRYTLVVDFDPPLLLDPGTFDLVHTVPEGFEPLRSDFAALECVEWVQVRDLLFAVTGSDQ